MQALPIYKNLFNGAMVVVTFKYYIFSADIKYEFDIEYRIEKFILSIEVKVLLNILWSFICKCNLIDIIWN